MNDKYVYITERLRKVVAVSRSDTFDLGSMRAVLYKILGQHDPYPHRSDTDQTPERGIDSSNVVSILFCYS